MNNNKNAKTKRLIHHVAKLGNRKMWHQKLKKENTGKIYLLYPGVFVLHNKWISQFGYELHLFKQENSQCVDTVTQLIVRKMYSYSFFPLTCLLLSQDWFCKQAYTITNYRIFFFFF